MSIAAYKTTIRESETPRQIERRVLSQVTGRLEARALEYDRASRRAERLSLLAEGLREDLSNNQRIWSELRHNLAEPENALPHDLRAQLLSIALWVERQTTEILGGSAGLASLVAVNQAVVAGLAGRTPGPQG